MAFEKIRTLQAQVDELQATHRQLVQRQAVDADHLHDADGLVQALLCAVGVDDIREGGTDADANQPTPVNPIINMLPARLRAALHGVEAMRGGLALSARGTEEHRQLRDELQATVREKAAIAAENAALRTEMRSLRETAVLLREEVDSSAEKLGTLEARMQRARAAEEQVGGYFLLHTFCTTRTLYVHFLHRL